MATRSLHQSRVIITGASGGIGAALARELAREGAWLVLLARRQQQLSALATELASPTVRVETVVGDVTDPEVRRQVIERAQQAYGGLDLLINNAGVGSLGRFATDDGQRLRHVMEVNFFAVAELTRAALPLLEQGNRPLIVNISSILGHRGLPRMSEYCASKFAIQGLSQSLRAELKPRGIDLLTVCPGTTRSKFFDHLVDQRGEIPWPTPRGQTPETVAHRIVRGICRGRREIYTDFPGRMLVLLQRLLPGIMDRYMARYG